MTPGGLQAMPDAPSALEQTDILNTLYSHHALQQAAPANLHAQEHIAMTDLQGSTDPPGLSTFLSGE